MCAVPPLLGGIGAHPLFSAYLFTPTGFTFFECFKWNYSTTSPPREYLAFFLILVIVIPSQSSQAHSGIGFETASDFTIRCLLHFFVATAGNKEEGGKAYKIHQVFHI